MYIGMITAYTRRLDNELVNMIKYPPSQFLIMLNAILRACNSAVNMLALPGNLTWAEIPAVVAAAATLSGQFFLMY